MPQSRPGATTSPAARRYRSASAGAASPFNMLTALLRPGSAADDLSNPEPRRLFRHCMRLFFACSSPLSHDYPLYEFTVLVRLVRRHGALVIFGAGDIARLAHVYFTRDSEHEVVAFAVDPGVPGSADELLGLAAARLRRGHRGSRRTAIRCSSPSATRRMNQRPRRTSTRAAKQRGYAWSATSAHAARSSTDEPRRRQLLHPRGQHHPAVRADRQRRDVVERQPHRPRLGHRRPLLHHLARRRLRAMCRSATIRFIGVNATLRNSITLAPRTLVAADYARYRAHLHAHATREIAGALASGRGEHAQRLADGWNRADGLFGALDARRLPR